MANVSLPALIVGFLSFFLREFIGCGALTDKSDQGNCYFFSNSTFREQIYAYIRAFLETKAEKYKAFCIKMP